MLRYTVDGLEVPSALIVLSAEVLMELTVEPLSENARVPTVDLRGE